MKKIKFKLVYLFLGFTVLQSCTDDLNVVSKDDDNLSPEQLFSTPNGYKQALGGVYGNLSLTGTGDAGSSFLQGIDAGTSNFNRCLWYLQELPTDEVIWSYENDGGTKDLQRNIWSDSNPLLLGMFSRTMAEVAIANEFLRQTTPEKVSGRGQSDAALLADINDYRNEAKVLRAYAYYNMMEFFGKAPFLTEADPLNFAGPQYDRAQLFSYLETELTTLIPLLKPARTNEYGRLDKAMAQMVLAKMYLNAEVYIGTAKYTECASICNDLIASGYILEPKYLDNFAADNNTSTEIIFALQSDGSVTQNYGATTTMVNGSVGSLEQNGSSLGVSAAAWGGALRLTKQFVQKFDGSDFENDARNTIMSGSRNIEITDIANRDQGYILTKYSNISSTGQAGPNTTFVDADFVLFRLADVYLMYAECAARGAGNADLGQALVYVNSLRSRAASSLATQVLVNQSQLTLDFILDERARELYWEGHRRQDLIRFNKFTSGAYNWAWKGNGVNGIGLSPNLKVFPLPSASISANSNLTQNPGY